MSKSRIFKISLGKNEFSAGELVHGHVVVELKDPLEVRAIDFQFDGYSHVGWLATSDSETYFHFESVLCGNAGVQRGDDLTLHPGVHSYPFQYQLPTDIPSSFEGSHGHVRYRLHATIIRPHWVNMTCHFDLTVHSLVDLNQLPDMKKVGACEEVRTGCMGTLSTTFSIDRFGYVPGESIVLKGEIKNTSNRILPGSEVYLERTDIYRSKSGTKTCTKRVATVHRGKILARETDGWLGMMLKIPQLPPSGLIHCSLIDTNYLIKMIVKTGVFGANMVLKLDCFIGTIPLKKEGTAMRRVVGIRWRIAKANKARAAKKKAAEAQARNESTDITAATTSCNEQAAHLQLTQANGTKQDDASS